MNNLPNFLVVGTAKAGTTSLYEHLINSSEVFPLKVKEPSFFSYQNLNTPQNGKKDYIKEDITIKTIQDYYKLFKGSEKYKIIGDFSVENLYYSKTVIPLIKEHLGDKVKILIVLRNPVERAISAYKHLKRDLREEKSFKEACDLEKKRIENDFAVIWHYKSMGLYHDDIKAYIENFDNVKILFYEDLRKNSAAFMQEVESFLEIQPINNTKESDKKHNFSYIPKNKSIQKIISWENPIKRKIMKVIPHKLKNYIKELNSQGDFVVDYNTKKELEKYFSEDREKLEKLLNKDLSFWDIKNK